MQGRSKAQAIVKGLKAKRPSKADHDWISFDQAVGEVLNKFRLPHEAATMMLYGLIATKNVGVGDGKQHIEECTIAELEGKIAFVNGGDLKDWLRQTSSMPLLNRRDAVIKKMLDEGNVPGRGGTMKWKPFEDQVRNECKGWVGKAQSVAQRRASTTGHSNAQLRSYASFRTFRTSPRNFDDLFALTTLAANRRIVSPRQMTSGPRQLRDDPMQRLLNTAEAAEICCLSPRTMERLRMHWSGPSLHSPAWLGALSR